VAAARGLAVGEVERVIADNTVGPWLGIFGQPHVNVLKANLALDALKAQAHPKS
jgi:K+-transporting ATPase ATPase C chain